LAGLLSYDICVLNLSERGLADDKLNHLLSNAPERSFILIEDVDAAFNKRVRTTEDGLVSSDWNQRSLLTSHSYQSSVTFSGFLNALDGVASGEERIVFMTTNHAEKLDPALVRPGRVDLIVHIDDASPVQATLLFTQFYGGSGDLADEEIQGLAMTLRKIFEEERRAGKRASMAALQGLFIRNGGKEAVAACRDIFVPKEAQHP